MKPTTPRKSILLPAMIAGTLIVAPAAAFAAPMVGDMLGKSETDIRTALEQQGLIVDEIEMEDGVFEVEVADNGEDFEFEVDAATGQIIKIDKDD